MTARIKGHSTSLHGTYHFISQCQQHLAEWATHCSKLTKQLQAGQDNMSHLKYPSADDGLAGMRVLLWPALTPGMAMCYIHRDGRKCLTTSRR